MIKLHTNIIVGSPNDLAFVFQTVNYIINSSPSLNNLINHPNFINFNINSFSFDTLQPLVNLAEFVKNKISLNQNIFLLCESGLLNSLILGMFIIMKFYNLDFDTVFQNISNTYHIHPYNSYSLLKYYEPYILSYPNSEKMDIS